MKERDFTISRLQAKYAAAADSARNHQAIAREDLEKIRARTLASLRLGKQAPGYKAAKQALDEFIDQLQGEEE